MALYILRKRVEEVLELHDALMVAYALGMGFTGTAQVSLQLGRTAMDRASARGGLRRDNVAGDALHPGTGGWVASLHSSRARNRSAAGICHRCRECTLSPGAIAGSLGRCHEVRRPPSAYEGPETAISVSFLSRVPDRHLRGLRPCDRRELPILLLP